MLLTGTASDSIALESGRRRVNHPGESSAQKIPSSVTIAGILRQNKAILFIAPDKRRAGQNSFGDLSEPADRLRV